MTIDTLQSKIPDFAKDIRLNMSNLFGNIDSTGLTKSQFYGTALSVAYSLKDVEMQHAILETASEELSAEVIQAAKIAAVIMAMNNIYYRAIHLADNPELTSLPANLRMNAMMNPGVSKVDFELYCLAVSAISGCGRCIQSHTQQLFKSGITIQSIQSALRLAATLNAAALSVAL